MPTGRKNDNNRPTAKKTTAKVAASRVKKTGITGQAKSGKAARQKANAGVSDGDIRRGKGNRGYNRYNASTGRWERVIVTKPSKAAKPAAKTESKVKDTKASRIGGYTPGTPSQTPKNTGWWSNNKYPAKYS